MPQLCNIYKSIKFVYIASKIFAILPFTITSEDVLKINSCRYSLWFIILSACVTLFSTVLYPISVFQTEGYCFVCLLFSDNSNTTSSLSFSNITISTYKQIAVKVVNRYFVSSMSGASIIFALFHSAKLPLLLHKLNQSDKYFRVLLKHSVRKVECCISFWIVVGILIISMPTMGYYMFVELKRLNVSPSIVFTVLVLVWESFNSTVCEAQFINLAYLLQVRFRIINNYLADLRNSNTAKFGRSFRESTRTRKKYQRSDHQVAPILSEISNPLPLTSRLPSLEMCRRCHRHLCEMITDMNNTYELIFVSTCTVCFLRILYCIFSITVLLTDQWTDSMFEETLKRAFFLISYAARFFAIILSAHQTVEEGVFTREVVAELSFSIEDREIEKELVLFYNQLKNRRIKFSAYSLFILNPEIILSAVGVGTTYLVILVQFQAPSD